MPAPRPASDERAPLRDPQLTSDVDEEQAIRAQAAATKPAWAPTLIERFLVSTLPATPCQGEVSVALALKPTMDAYGRAGVLWSEDATDPWQLWFAAKETAAVVAYAAAFAAEALWRAAAACATKKNR